MKNNSIAILFFAGFCTISAMDQSQIRERFSLIESTMNGKLHVENEWEKRLSFPYYYASSVKHFMSLGDVWTNLSNSIERVENLRNQNYVGFVSRLINLYSIIKFNNDISSSDKNEQIDNVLASIETIKPEERLDLAEIALHEFALESFQEYEGKEEFIKYAKF